jgi:hypothetical protein
VLAAAGYDNIAVVHEQLGYSRLSGDAAMRIPCADSIVAFVAAEDNDLVLRNLPDSFEVAGQACPPPSLWMGAQHGSRSDGSRSSLSSSKSGSGAAS